MGAWNNPNYPGLQFGWAKAYYYHKLDLQPILDGIGIGSVGKGHPYALRVFHYNADDEVNLQVRIQTAVATYQNNYSMHNTGPVGVLTAYCAGPDYPQNPIKYCYPKCPSWVNTSL